MKSRILLMTGVAVAVLLAVALAGCGSKAPAASTTGGTGSSGGSASGAAGAVTVVEQNFEFTPSAVTAKVGDTITFANKDSVPHRVDVNGQDLGQQEPGASVTWKATAAGPFPFKCTIHPAMVGQITVQ